MAITYLGEMQTNRQDPDAMGTDACTVQYMYEFSDVNDIAEGHLERAIEARTHQHYQQQVRHHLPAGTYHRSRTYTGYGTTTAHATAQLNVHHYSTNYAFETAVHTAARWCESIAKYTGPTVDFLNEGDRPLRKFASGQVEDLLIQSR